MSFEIGLIAALIAAICWGSYFVPMKKVKQYDPFYFQALMCVAIFISSAAVSLYYNSFSLSYYGIISGAIWAVGNMLSAFAVKEAGLTKAVPIWVAFATTGAFLSGVFFFNESFNSILMSVAGLILIMAGVFVVSSTNEEKIPSNFKGIVLAVISGMIFGVYLIPLKLANVEPTTFLFPMSVGALITGLLIYLLKRSPIDKSIILPGFLSGLVWNVANFASFFVVANLGLALGFPLTQIAIFISVSWGLFYFKEITGKNSVRKLVVGAVVLFIGAIVLALAK